MTSLQGQITPSHIPSERRHRDDVLQTVAQLIREVIGEAYAGDMEIVETTAFAGEIELESVELVALSAALTERFGERIALADWLAGMEIEQLTALCVGDLVERIYSCTFEPATT